MRSGGSDFGVASRRPQAQLRQLRLVITVNQVVRYSGMGGLLRKKLFQNGGCLFPVGDSTFANRKKAAAVLEELFAEEPTHPGVAHYLIHSYDKPQLAELCLRAARSYAKIAPAAPHALHMPSH